MKQTSKFFLTLMVPTFFLATANAQVNFQLQGITSVVVPVTLNKMTNLIFPEAIQTGVKISRDVQAQKVHAVENVIELRATRRNFPPTNLSVYDKDGRLYSFVLQYVEDTSVLNFRVVPSSSLPAPSLTQAPLNTPPLANPSFPPGGSPILLTGLPVPLPRLHATATTLEQNKSSLRTSARSEGLCLRLRGAYIRDSLQWLVFKVTSRSRLPYTVDQVRFFFRDKKAVKRKAMQESDMTPVFLDDPSTAYLQPQSTPTDVRTTNFAAAFQPIHTVKGKKLIIEITTSDGRTVTLSWKKWRKMLV